MIPINNHQPIVKQLKRHFFRGSLDFDTEAKEITKLSWDQQKDFLDDTVNNWLTKKYPVKIEFSKLFFKKMIEYLEGTQEVHDDLYKHLCMTMHESENNTFYYRHYVIGDDLMNRIIIKETNKLVVNGTTGMRTWEASLMLVDWALHNKELFKKKHVLELGSGIGFTGISIAKHCQPHTVLMSDCHPDVLSVVEENININFSDLERRDTSDEKIMFRKKDYNIGVINLDWTDLCNISDKDLSPDIIVGADIIYDPAIVEALFNTLMLFFKRNKNVEVYIAGVIRNEETYHTFLRKIREAAQLRVENICHDKNVFIEWNRDIATFLIKVKL